MRLHTKIILLVIAVGFVPGQPAHAQRNSAAEFFAYDFENAVKDILFIWTSPARMRLTDVPSLLLLSHGVVLAGRLDADIQKLVADHRGSIPVRAVAPFEEPAFGNLFGRSLLLQPISLLLYTGGLLFEEEALREAGIGCSAATFSNTIARHVIARVGGRLRPRYATTPYEIQFMSGKEWERRSFPNGHGSNAMTCASFWNHRFDLGMLEPVLYAMAGAVGFARITAEAHWASDTVFGLVFGFVIGRTVAERFEDREVDELQSLQSGAARLPALRIGWSIPVR